MGARNQGHEIFIFKIDPRHVILGIFISKNLFWASVYDFYINYFQGTWAFYKKYRGHWSLGLQFNSWGFQVSENFDSKKFSTRQKLLFENRIKKIGMIIKNWLEKCPFFEWMNNFCLEKCFHILRKFLSRDYFFNQPPKVDKLLKKLFLVFFLFFFSFFFLSSKS